MKTEAEKVDQGLGKKVQQHLLDLGLETPMLIDRSDTPQEKRRKRLEELMAGVMGELLLDLSDDSLAETPKRVAKMFLNELFWGLNYENFPKGTVIENKMKFDEMLVERNITLRSFCEHHLLPIVGVCHVAYIPKDKVLGLSKFNRIVDFFSRRPQVQERLTAQIFETLKFLLETDNVAVFVEAEHMCVKLRGVEDACSDTATSKLGGVFKDTSVRAEFYSIVSMKRGV